MQARVSDVAVRRDVGSDELSLERSTGYARARLGLIMPAGNQLIEPQFQHFAPPGVGVHVARLQMNGKYAKPLRHVTLWARELEDACADRLRLDMVKADRTRSI